MSRDEVYATLSGKILGDETWNDLEQYFDLSNGCPTCHDVGYYNLDNKTVDCDCDYQKLLQKHYWAANIGREYHDICLGHFMGIDADHVVPKAKSYIDNFDSNFHFGVGITATGPVGTGKTFVISSILKELIKQGRNVYFITFEQLIDTWGSSWHDDKAKKKLQDKLKAVDVLGIDELRTDARNSGGFLASGLESVIRHRTSNLLPTLLTTNMSADDEKDEFFKAYSLLSARNERIVTTGADLRNGPIRERIFELKTRGDRRPVC